MSDEWVKVYVRKGSYNKVIETLNLAMNPDEWVAVFASYETRRKNPLDTTKNPVYVKDQQDDGPAKNPASQNPTN